MRGLDDKGRKYPGACFPGSGMIFCGLSLRRGRFFVPVFPGLPGYAGQASGGLGEPGLPAWERSESAAGHEQAGAPGAEAGR